MKNLELTDAETVALINALKHADRRGSLPTVAAGAHTGEDPEQAEAGASSTGGIATAPDLRAAVERAIQAARLSPGSLDRGLFCNVPSPDARCGRRAGGRHRSSRLFSVHLVS